MVNLSKKLNYLDREMMVCSRLAGKHDAEVTKATQK